LVHKVQQVHKVHQVQVQRVHAFTRFSNFVKIGIRVLAAGLWLTVAATAAAQQENASAAAAIDGPPAPAAPAVMARDARGRVTIRAVRVEPLRIDGLLDEAAYRDVEPLSEFVQQEPREGERVTEPTDVWVLFDGDQLYISGRCRDSQPHRIVANDMRREGRNITQGDNFSIVIDTFYDRRNGYEFLVNAVGGMVDNQITDERDINRDWNAVWTAQSRWDGTGWTFEVAIPFRSLRYRGAGAQIWGINLRRTIRWKNEYAYISAVPRLYGPRGILRFSQAATLIGLEAPPAALNLEVKPFAVAGTRADRAVDASFNDDVDGDAGFDLKYGMTRSLTADFTYRTDFAQVEDDDQQVNLTRFNQFFPEKREFFLEGQGIFGFGGVESGSPRAGRTTLTPTNTPVLFFSRQIGLFAGRPVPIEAGGRMTGKVGKYSVGLLEIQTDDDEATGARATNFAVARVKRDILRRSYIGLIGTRRSPMASASGAGITVGADASLSFFQSLNILGFYARTNNPGARGDEHSYRARFDYEADLFALQAESLAVGRNFRPEIGFLRRSDIIQNFIQTRVSRRPASRTVRKVNLEAGLDYLTNGRRDLENRQARVAMRTEFHSADAWHVEYTRNFEFVPVAFPAAGIRVAVGAYHSSNLQATYTLGPQRRVAGDITVARGGFYGGDRTDVGYRGRVEVNRHLSFEPGLSLNRLDLPDGRALATLASTRATFSFTPRMWLGALVQFNSTNHLVSANMRFRWEYRPGSDFFIVYSDGRDTLERGFPQLQTRIFTIKLTRLLRF